MPAQTVADLGKAFKLSQNGAYDDIDDASIGRAVKAKHPGAYDDFSDESPPTLLRSTTGKSFPSETTGNPVTDAFTGIGASLYQIPAGIYNLGRKFIDTAHAGPSPPPLPQWAQDLTVPPDTPGGHIGEFLGDVGTFALPGGIEEKAISKIGATSRLGKAAARAAVQGTSAAGTEYIKSGGDLSKAAAAGVTSGAVGGVLDLAGKPILHAITDLWGKATGAGGEAIRTAAQQTASQGFMDAMRYKRSEDQIVGDLNSAVKDVMNKRANDYRSAMSQLDPNIRLNLSPVLRELTDQAKAYGVTPLMGKGRAFINSPVVGKADQDAMLKAVGDITRWSDFSPAGMDTLKQRLTGYADQVSPRVQPFFYRIADSVKRELGDNVPGYRDLTKDYSAASDLLSQVRKELSAGATNPGVTMRKLTYIFNQNNEFRKILLESLDDAAGSDLKNTMAGYALRTPIPRGLAGVMAGGAATYLHNPAMLTGAAFGSPRVAGEAMALLSALRRSKVGGAASFAGGGLPPALSNQLFGSGGEQQLMPPPR